MTRPGAEDNTARVINAYSRETVLGTGWPAVAPAATPPDIVVDSETFDQSPGQFRDLQAAIDMAIRNNCGPRKDKRRVIEIRPGFYPGPVILPAKAPPLTLRGPGPTRAVIAAGIDAGMSGQGYAARFGARFENSPGIVREIAARIAARQRIGTGNTALFRIERSGTAVSGLTIRNDYACDRAEAAPAGAEPDAEGRYTAGQHQAVALHVAGADRVRLADLNLSSYQDTLYLQAGDHPDGARVHLDSCLIEGDVDFIFGGATAYFESCEIRSRGSRGARSWALAPSTPLRRAHGFVLDKCTFSHDGVETGRAGASFLGRQWFEGVRATPYGDPNIADYRTVATDTDRYDAPKGRISRRALEAVGKCAVLRSTFGPHLDRARLWDDWAAGIWTPRFRPVQPGAAAFLDALGPWLAENGLDYRDLDRAERWLVEIGCTHA